MAVEKKHTFKGLDLRTNILTREDGTAADCSNVYLDESRNLLKRKEMKKLEVPYGPDSKTELFPGTTILEVIEYIDEILLFTYFKGDLSFYDTKLEREFEGGITVTTETTEYVTATTWANKLYRVTNLNTTPVTIEEIPNQSQFAWGSYMGHPLGRVSTCTPTISMGINYTISGKTLFISGVGEDDQHLYYPGTAGDVVRQPLKLDSYSCLLRYDGEVYHTAGTLEMNIPSSSLEEDFTAKADVAYCSPIHYYIDANGLQVYGSGETFISKVNAGGSGLPFDAYAVANGMIGDLPFDPDNDPYGNKIQENLGKRGGHVFLDPEVYWGDSTYSNDGWSNPWGVGFTQKPPFTLKCISVDAVEGTWVVHRGETKKDGGDSRTGPIRWRISSILKTNPYEYAVTFDKRESYDRGAWRGEEEGYLPTAYWPYTTAYPVERILGATNLAAYFTKQPGATHDFQAAMGDVIVPAGGLFYESYNYYGDSTIIGVSSIPFGVTSYPHLGFDRRFHPTYFLMPPITRGGTIYDPTPKYGGPPVSIPFLAQVAVDLVGTGQNFDPDLGFIPSMKLEDFYDISQISFTPRARQILSVGTGTVLHDGDSVYISSTSLNVTSDFYTVFPISVGSPIDGKIVNVLVFPEYTLVNRETRTFIISGDIFDGNIRSREVKGDSYGSVSPSAILNMAGLPTFVSRQGVFASQGGPNLIGVGSKINRSIEEDHYKLGLKMSEIRMYLSKREKKAYVSLPGTIKNTVMVFDYDLEEWFKYDGFPVQGGLIEISNPASPLFEEIIGCDGVDLYREIPSYINGVDAFYKSNYLTANEPSLKKQWHKCVVFLVGSPSTKIIFDSSEDWGKGESEADCKDTLVVSNRYVVDLKSFAPSNSYSRSVNLESLGTNELLINGFQVTYDYAQDEVVDENE